MEIKITIKDQFSLINTLTMTKYFGDSFLGGKEFSYFGGRNINWHTASVMLLDNIKILNAFIIWSSDFTFRNVL